MTMDYTKTQCSIFHIIFVFSSVPVIFVASDTDILSLSLHHQQHEGALIVSFGGSAGSGLPHPSAVRRDVIFN